MLLRAVFNFNFCVGIEIKMGHYSFVLMLLIISHGIGILMCFFFVIHGNVMSYCL